MNTNPASVASRIDIRPLRLEDLDEADRIFRLAFGTFLGLPDPLSFAGDADFARTRWQASPQASFGAYRGDQLVGSNFAARWGSFAFFGPLTVRPDLWDQGIARHLLDATLALFKAWGVRHAGLFTFPHSAKHLAMYQKHGFWPRQLTPVMSRPVTGTVADPGHWRRFSTLPPEARITAVAACSALTDAILPGLDLASEINAVSRQRIGDTVLVYDDGELSAFAVCHAGKGSEAGSGKLYVKFGAARPGADAGRRFGRLLAACTSLAAGEGLEHLVVGVNTSRLGAYQSLLAGGFRIELVGVAMQMGDGDGHNRPDCFVMDDWR